MTVKFPLCPGMGVLKLAEGNDAVVPAINSTIVVGIDSGECHAGAIYPGSDWICPRLRRECFEIARAAGDGSG